MVRMLCRKEIAAALGVGGATTYRMQKRKELPEPKRISVGRVGWPEDEFKEYLRNLPRASSPSDRNNGPGTKPTGKDGK